MDPEDVAVKKALAVFEGFYSAQAALVQIAFKRQVPELESYKGRQGGRRGVIDMLDVIHADFLRLETTSAEQRLAAAPKVLTSMGRNANLGLCPDQALNTYL